MKRLFAGLLIPTTIFLCSCEVHLGETRFEVPWWVIAIPTGLFVIIVLVIAYLCRINKTYRCPVCGTRFKPKKSEISVMLKMLNYHNETVVRCPNCKRKGFCPEDEE